MIKRITITREFILNFSYTFTLPCQISLYMAFSIVGTLLAFCGIVVSCIQLGTASNLKRDVDNYDYDLFFVNNYNPRFNFYGGYNYNGFYNYNFELLDKVSGQQNISPFSIVRSCNQVTKYWSQDFP